MSNSARIRIVPTPVLSGNSCLPPLGLPKGVGAGDGARLDEMCTPPPAEDAGSPKGGVRVALSRGAVRPARNHLSDWGSREEGADRDQQTNICHLSIKDLLVATWGPTCKE